jgi:hypothetical protein
LFRAYLHAKITFTDKLLVVNLDYSPLNEKHPTAILSDRTDIPKLNNTAGAIFLTVLIVAVTGIFIIPILLSPLIYKILKNIISKSGDSAIRLSNFAVKNGFSFRSGIKGGNQFTKIGLSGVLGSTTHEVLASNVISGTYNGVNFELFNPYSKGFYSILKITLVNKYPHIVLDSRANNPFVSNIGHFFTEDSRIHLEGNFDKYFKVYAKAPAADTLRILSPDMMAIMIDSGHKYDIEIVENNLHVISNYKFSDEQGVKYFFDLADSLLDKLDRRNATRQATFDHDSKVT